VREYRQVHVVGLGGVGFWLVSGLAPLVDPASLHLWDGDRLEGGHGHTRLPVASPTTYKTDLARGHNMMGLGYRAAAQWTLHAQLFTGSCRGQAAGPGWLAESLVVDCTDMPLEPRRAMWARARRHHAQMLRVSYDGRGSTIVCSTGLPLADAPAGNYHTMPTLALSLAAGGWGAECVRRFLSGELPARFDVQISLTQEVL
jgi:hypothetical protein